MADPTRKRVVITGLGVITPLGQGIGTFWENLLAGQCGIGPVTAYDTEGYACAIAGEVKDFDPTPAFPSPKEVRRTDRFTDRKSTRLNSSHKPISYAVFCLKKKKKTQTQTQTQTQMQP